MASTSIPKAGHPSHSREQVQCEWGHLPDPHHRGPPNCPLHRSQELPLPGTGTGAGIPPGSLSWFVTPHWWCRPTAAATTSGPDTAPGSWSAHCRALTCAHVGSSRSSPARRCGPWPGPGRREAPRRGHEAEGRDAVGQGEPVQLQQRAADEPGKMPQSGSESLQAPPLPAYCGPTSARPPAAPRGLPGLVVQAAPAEAELGQSLRHTDTEGQTLRESDRTTHRQTEVRHSGNQIGQPSDT